MAAKLLDALTDLHKNQKSGVLRIERASAKKQLVLHKGLVAFAESNLREEHLVQIMIKMDLLSGAKVSEIASLMKSGKTVEEAILTASGIEALDVEKGRREQAVGILASLLSWDGGKLHFYSGETLIRCYLRLDLPIPELLVLSARRAVSEHWIPTPPGFLQGTYTLAKDVAENARYYPLNNLESFALSLLAEPTRLSDLSLILPASEVKPEELLLRLSALGLIEPFSPEGSVSTRDSNPLVQSIEDMHVRFESASLYEVLSIPATASQEAIQTAYYGLAKQYHPDRFQSNEYPSDFRSKAQRVFARINEAYITLKNPNSRAAYDETRFSKESKVEAELKSRGAGRSEDDKMAEAFFYDARVLLAKGDFEKAAERLNECVYLRPEKAAYHHWLGVAQSEIPKLRKSAEQHLLKALELDSTSVNSHLELAKLYIKVMLRRKAESQLQQTLRWDPENQEAQKLIAELKKH
jgi:curved DNA-binding protein CbpA